MGREKIRFSMLSEKYKRAVFSEENTALGAGNVTRTHDLLITNQLLYRLSYTSMRDTGPRNEKYFTIKPAPRQSLAGKTGKKKRGRLAVLVLRSELIQWYSCQNNPECRRWGYPYRRSRRSGRTGSRSGRSGGGEWCPGRPCCPPGCCRPSP